MKLRFPPFAALALGIGIAAGAASTASATVISYTTRAAFDAAVGPTTAEDFNSFAADASFISPASVSVGIMTFSSGPGANSGATNKIDASPFQFPGFYENGSSYVLGDIVVGSSSVRIDFSIGVTAWGGDLRGISDDGRVARIDVFDVADVLLGSVLLPTAAGTNNFRFSGFALTGSDVAGHVVFTSVVDSGNDAWGLDDVAIRPVPEPTTLALLGAGLVAVRARRRRNS
ncbi:MAG TPA: PEP-CTERM sorting domain-containing protein [Vicinamibacteria bacterium]|nr:PEP-CTERM sorting domain-containing protein [Vicinamibacteria bacterium]